MTPIVIPTPPVPTEEALALIASLGHHANPEKAKGMLRFFKTGPGQYGEGDQFLGIAAPVMRQTIRAFRALPLSDLSFLLHSPIHEVRSAALLIMVYQYQRASGTDEEALLACYLGHTHRINNWDLVDLSAPHILGTCIYRHPERLPLLDELAASSLLWEQRMAVVANWELIRKGIYDPVIRLTTQLRHHPHDLMQKANGWMLRELGKKEPSLLLDFLDRHAREIPRTMLRYAIERLTPEQRRHYMAR